MTDHTPGPPGTTVLHLRGDLDHDSERELAATVDAAVARSTGALVLDVSGVTFADSSTLRTLVLAQQRMEAADGALVLLGPLGPALRRLLEITATDGYFTVADSLPLALAAAGELLRRDPHDTGSG
ncbi:STAS domain-containing protein [Kitasatospora sp. NA04385]|uniref:STAS domain-containing protein n=1 Tax=Kitasatospora sp. NA04385 TaxID=2742135 RepID=UPI00158FB3D1|nr:STAS domain-containing protein [Kitasatospora sp. NA04385]QKW17960.1 STAS domain-containing protein [Kitasatospora sp. NA04385]